ncbi:MAG TPA: BadF/BadG/BcrA/BcrD ATPase family protein [Pseudolysinimonas sp.]|nr:BadF/BadG/BcrA/BcrD ATPase family protein [Pseudolysinimonas sp.]
MTGVVVGVDGGGSKTDAVALSLDGELIGRGAGPGSSPHFVGVDRSLSIVDTAVRTALGGREATQVNVYLSGLDLDSEVAAYADAASATSWAGTSTVVENDLWALLRTGTESADAVAVVCGTGINAVGVRADGATVRFPALGGISGDWGGGSGLGEEVLWHSARMEDGRGPATALREALLAAMRVPDVRALIEQLHSGTVPLPELATLAPAVFEAARAGDAVARTIVDRQAAEVVAFARAALTRLGLLDTAVPVVLGGGVIRARDRRLLSRIAAGLAADAPAARMVIVDDRPIVGAGLLALASAGATAGALKRARMELTA